MIKLNNLNGKLRQTTIHGELSFIKGNIYKVFKTNVRGVVNVVGEYQIYDSDELINATIEISELELEKY